MNELQLQFKRGCFNPKDIYPPLEEISINTPYALTITPQDQQHGQSPRLYSFNIKSQDTLKYLPGTYKLYTELSTKSCNIHYHGTIIFKDALQIATFYMNIPKIIQMASISLKPITSWEWTPYCIKQRHIMEPYCNSMSVEYKKKGGALRTI